jgi:predicted nuclease of predicted toxin-antitoxin system
MKVLLDECAPARLSRSLSGHDCQTVQRTALSGRRNGELLRMADELRYNVLLTVDQNLPYQQRIEGRRIAVLILIAESNQISICCR